MEIVRFLINEWHILGRLITDKGTVFYSVECPWKNNEPFLSCVPCGFYEVKLVDSPKYGDNTFELQNVLNRTHCLFHVANTAKDVTGCIGLGVGVYPNLSGVSSSRLAMAKFHEELDVETFMLTIRNGTL